MVVNATFVSNSMDKKHLDRLLLKTREQCGRSVLDVIGICRSYELVKDTICVTYKW